MRSTHNFFALALAVGLGSPLYATVYNIVDLGPVNPSAPVGYFAYGVNTLGQVVGQTQNLSTGVSYSPPGTAVNLGNLGGTGSTKAAGINTAGLIVGSSSTSISGVSQGFTYTAGGGMVTIGSLGGGANNSSLANVNESGTAAGYSAGFGGDSNAQAAITYSTAGGIVSLGQLASLSTFAYGINNAGDVVGAGLVVGGNHAWVDIGGTGLTDIGTLGGSTSVLFSINNFKEAVGYANTTANAKQDAISWTPSGGVVDLGTFNNGSFSYAEAVNDFGVLVGYGSAGSWLNDGTGFTDLNSVIQGGQAASGWNLQRAYGINNAGDIIGQGTFTGEGTTVKSAFELVPVAPEPASLGVLALGAFALLNRRRAT